jgi:tetratricopeptide (TPR) repeat protein
MFFTQRRAKQSFQVVAILLALLLVKSPQALAAVNDAFDRGSAQMVSMNYNDAIRSFDEAIGANQEFGEAYFKRGQCYFYLKNYDLAVTDFANVVKRDPRNSDAFLFRGVCRANLGKDDLAIRDFGRALKLNPDLAQAYVEPTFLHGRQRRGQASAEGSSGIGELMIKRGNAFIKLGQNDKAVEDFVAATKLGSDTDAAFLNRGLANVSKTRNSPSAEKEKDDLVITTPNDARTFELRASAFLNVKQPKKAIEDLNDALEMDPQNDGYYFRRGCAYEELGNLTRACEEYAHAAYINPLAKYYLARAHCYQQMNKTVLAKADIRHARQINPNLPRRIIFKDDVELTPDQ